MLVELTTSRASLRGFHDVGDVIEVSAKEGKRLIEDNQALPVRSRPVETTSLRRRGRPKKETTNG